MVASRVEDEVMEYTRKIVRNPQFIKDYFAQLREMILLVS